MGVDKDEESNCVGDKREVVDETDSLSDDGDDDDGDEDAHADVDVDDDVFAAVSLSLIITIFGMSRGGILLAYFCYWA